MGGAIGIFEHGVSARIEDCKFMGNYGGLLGGAMVALRIAFVDVISSQFVENLSDQFGGAMYCEVSAQRFVHTLHFICILCQVKRTS